MTLAVTLFGVFIAVLGVVGFLSPPRLLALVARAVSQLGLYLIAGIRLLLGVTLLIIAPSSNAPAYLQILGVVAIFSGIVTPFFGVRRFERMVDWWRKLPTWSLRLWSVFVFVFGLSLIWAVIPVSQTP
jgi:hypothetical protein